MPEYLAPAVYVEEVDTGSKPIEGVSTSTAAFVGVTERGPLNIPILVTGYGEFVRWFGDTLNPAIFGPHCFLPHAVEGFFANGGKRLFVVRVLEAAQAAFASTMLFDRGTAAGIATTLIQPAAAGTNGLYVANGAGLTGAGTWLQIGTGSGAEFLQVAAAPARTDVSLRSSLRNPHAAALTVEHLANLGAALAQVPTLTVATAPGDPTITLTAPGAIGVGDVLQIGATPNDEEYVTVVAPLPVAPSRTYILSNSVQFAHPVAEPVSIFALAGIPAVNAANQSTLSSATDVGATSILVLNPAPFAPVPDFVRVVDGNATEIRRLGQMMAFTPVTPAYSSYPIGSVVEAVTIVTGAVAYALARDTTPGLNTIELLDRTGLNPGDVLQIGVAGDADREYLTIQPGGLPNPQPGPTNPGVVVLSQPIRFRKVQPSQVRVVNAPIPRAALPRTAIAAQVAPGDTTLVVGGGNGFPAANVLRVWVGATPFYHVATALAVPVLPTPVTPAALTLTGNLAVAHAAGQPVIARAPLMEVRALDQGGWGNRLRVAVRDNRPAVVRSTIIGPLIDTLHIRLASANGVEQGTLLNRLSAAGAIVSSHKVADIDRQSFVITLDAGTPIVGAAVGDRIESQEFQLDVYLLRQPDPAVPTRGNTVLLSETFPQLSLDARHSRYIHRVIGATWTLGAAPPVDDDVPSNPLRRADRRSEGGSWLVRIRDVAAGNTLPVRQGPALLTDTLPDGRIVPARLALVGGNDNAGAVTNTTYIGAPSADPENRTGMYALENEEDVSIVACPGQTHAQIQGALINHCELMRYRFAVLDGPRPPADSLNDAQVQRQQFDTKYAAFYHPWLLIPEPYPANLARIADYPIPPSGHMTGIYARTDIERGVHKAPANEVVRGIIGLQRRLNKSEHDILNPSPVNINVIRDFRENSRGIRVYGGRVITSDTDWKYVNVRRLLIFIEASIDRGLQWVVFEPNAEPLWARVRRSISNFLTLVWRNGGLEGTKVEEAYFVKCDRTTMTQTDIDSGRLICLVGVAPVKPAEFVIVRIGLWTAHADD